MDTHTHTQTDRESERERDPKHQNSINPLRRSLKGFLKADFHHTEAFQVSTVCGGNGAEAFKLHALTFPLCYFLFLPLTHTVFLPFFFFFLLCIFLFPRLLWGRIHTYSAKSEKEKKEKCCSCVKKAGSQMHFQGRVHTDVLRQNRNEHRLMMTAALRDRLCRRFRLVITALSKRQRRHLYIYVLIPFVSLPFALQNKSNKG